jgi:hypothetical protein
MAGELVRLVFLALVYLVLSTGAEQLDAQLHSEYSAEVNNWRSILTIIVFLIASKFITLYSNCVV